MTATQSGRFEGLEPVITVSADHTVTPRYELSLDGETLDVETLLGAGVQLTFVPPRHCVNCSKTVTKLYAGGHCYDCFSTLARCDLCVVSPDRCHFAAGTCREPDWGEQFCMQPHTVYLAHSSGPKIGLTRRGREHRRWLDQGASAAMVVAHTPSRRAAGLIEAHCRRYVNDRTDWRKLVSGAAQAVDLADIARILRREIPQLDALEAANVDAREMAASVWLSEEPLFKLRYPVNRFSPAERIVLNAEHPQVRDNLQGVIGQYLLFSRGVFNVAEHRGVSVDISLGPAYAPADISNNEQMNLF